MTKENNLSAERLRSMLRYDPQTGSFIWLVAKGRRVRIGALAGNIDGQGYVRIRIDGRGYRAHRLAWLYMTNEWPVQLIDHRNRQRDDNRWSNLRSATFTQNCGNSDARPNRTGYRGVKVTKSGTRYAAYIRERGRMRSLGEFPTAAEAHKAYCHAALEQFGEFASVA